MYLFLFNRTTLQVFVTYLIDALYAHPLWFYKHQHDNLKCIVYDKLLKPRQSFRIILHMQFKLDWSWWYKTKVCLCAVMCCMWCMWPMCSRTRA